MLSAVQRLSMVRQLEQILAEAESVAGQSEERQWRRKKKGAADTKM